MASGDLALSGGDVSYTYDGGSGLKTQRTLTTPSSAQKVTKYLYFRDGSLKDVRWPTSTWLGGIK